MSSTNNFSPRSGGIILTILQYRYSTVQYYTYLRKYLLAHSTTYGVLVSKYSTEYCKDDKVIAEYEVPVFSTKYLKS